MKHLLFFLFVTFCWHNSSAQQSSTRVTIDVKHLGDSLFVEYSTFSPGDFSDFRRVEDTLAAKKGRYVQVDIPADHQIWTVHLVPLQLWKYRTAWHSFHLMPGERLHLTGCVADSILEVHISGSAYYEAERKFTKEVLEPQRRKLEKTAMRRGVPLKRGDAVPGWSRVVDSLFRRYVVANPGAELSMGMVSSMSDPDTMAHYYALLADSVRNGRFKPLIGDRLSLAYRFGMLGYCDWVDGPRVPALGFTLPRSDGGVLSLDSLRGKYVLLDFWGTQSDWSVEEFALLKVYYAKYKDRLEIVGVNTFDSVDRWRTAVAEYDLPWPNVRNDERQYYFRNWYVSSAACAWSRVLIDPEGRLVQIFPLSRNSDRFSRYSSSLDMRLYDAIDVLLGSAAPL